MRTSTGSAIGAGVLALSMLLGGCSASDTAAACQGIDEVASAVSGLSTKDLKTVADYRKKLDEVQANLNSASSDVGAVGKALLAALNKLITELDDKLATLDQEKSLADTGIDFEAAQKSIDDALNKLSDALSCPA